MTPQTLITHPTMENFVAATGQTAVKAAEKQSGINNFGQCGVERNASQSPKTMLVASGSEAEETSIPPVGIVPATVHPFPREKYFILDVNGIPTPVKFPAHLPHDTCVPKDKDGNFIYPVISAGFCEVKAVLVPDPRRYSDEAKYCGFEDGFLAPKVEVIVSGYSNKLNAVCRPEDAEIIRRAL